MPGTTAGRRASQDDGHGAEHEAAGECQAQEAGADSRGRHSQGRLHTEGSSTGSYRRIFWSVVPGILSTENSLRAEELASLGCAKRAISQDF